MRDSIEPRAYVDALRALAKEPERQALRDVLEKVDTHNCGCLWCEQPGDRSTKTPPGKRVLSAYCAALLLSTLVDEPTSELAAEQAQKGASS